MPVLPLVASITIWPGESNAPALGVLDHAEGKPVLDRAHWIEGLDLDVEIDALRSELVDLDDGRATYGLEDVGELLRHGAVSRVVLRERGQGFEWRIVAHRAAETSRGARLNAQSDPKGLLPTRPPGPLYESV